MEIVEVISKLIDAIRAAIEHPKLFFEMMMYFVAASAAIGVLSLIPKPNIPISNSTNAGMSDEKVATERKTEKEIRLEKKVMIALMAVLAAVISFFLLVLWKYVISV